MILSRAAVLAYRTPTATPSSAAVRRATGPAAEHDAGGSEQYAHGGAADGRPQIRGCAVSAARAEQDDETPQRHGDEHGPAEFGAPHAGVPAVPQ